MMKRKFVGLLAAVALLACLCGCSADGQGGGGGEKAEPKALAQVVALDFEGREWSKEMLEQGRLLAQNIGLADDGTMLWYIDYEYNENGQIVKALVYDAEGNLQNPEPEEDQQ